MPDHKNHRRCRLHFRVFGLPIQLTRCAVSAGSPSGPRAWPFNHRLTMINSVFQIVKELHAAESGQRGVLKRHNAKTPVMRYLHQPGFLRNPREVRGLQHLPNLFRRVTAYRSLPKYWRGGNENSLALNSYRLNDDQNHRHSRISDR